MKKRLERPGSISEAYPFIEAYNPKHDDKPQLDCALENTGVMGLKTHLDSSYFHRQLEDQDNCPKFLVVARNPKDSLVSFYHFHRGVATLNYTDPFDAFFEIFRSGKLLYGSSIDNVLSWWKYRNHPQVHFIKYEDMLNDPLKHIKDIGGFIGCALTEQEAEVVRNASSMTTMRNRGIEAYYKNSEMFKENTSPYFRKGVIGDWRSMFTEEQSLYVDKLVQDKWVPAGLRFDE